MNEFQNKTAAVIGLARAGAPAAKFLLERGARVFGYDSKSRDELIDEALELETLGATLHLGQHGFVDIEFCDLIVLSPGLKVHFEPLKSLIDEAEKRGAEVIGELELASRFCPCLIIGVTGTKGKSTTTKLITEMLRACGVDAHSAGNTGTPLISILPELSSDSWAVVEVSSFQLEKAPTFRPKIAVLLSLLEDHQDYHPTLEQYWETKLKIFDNQGKGDVAIFNWDDSRVEKLSEDAYKEEVLPLWTLGRNLNADETQDDIDFFWYNDALDWNNKPLVKADEFPLKGQHNRANVAAAFAAVWAVLRSDRIEKDKDKIADAIRNFQSLPHRLEIVARRDNITFVNDSQSTIPDATIAALKSFPSPVTLLVGGRAKIEAEGYANLMRAVKSHNARLVLFGEAKEMLTDVFLSIGGEKLLINVENTLSEAVQIAKMKASNGETIVLSPACASFDQFTSYEHRGNTFRELVNDLPFNSSS